MATEIYLGNPPENIVNWIKAEAERKQRERLKEPLCFTSEDTNTAVCLNNNSADREISIVTSTDKQNWTPYEIGSEITLENVGDKVYFRAADDIENWTFSGYNFHVFGHVAASGNLNTLLKADGYVLDFSIEKDGEDRHSCYASLFQGCEYLTQAPELPATTLAYDCYNQMFAGCTFLKQAPSILPATTLASSCYNGMFIGCAYLTQAPELPATILADGCYSDMFRGCAHLTQAPELPATTLASCCYCYMFSGCTSLAKAPELLAMELASDCYSYMFEGCTSLTQAPELPATTLAMGCYNGMFSECSLLTQAPSILPATELADYCYGNMFFCCSSLTKAPELPAETLIDGCYNGMFCSCISLTQASFPNLEKETVATEVVENYGAFYDAASNIEATCYDGILIINSTEA